MAFGELCRSARTGCWGKNHPKTSMGGFHKFRFNEMRGISLPSTGSVSEHGTRRCRGAFSNNGWSSFLDKRDGNGNRNQSDAECAQSAGTKCF